MPFSTPTERAAGDFQSHSLDDHDEELNAIEDQPSSPFVQLACRSCRLRKVRCDRKRPCTQCVRKHVECSFPSGKLRERRWKALVLSLYEATLADISQKLDQLTDVVNNYTFSQSSRLSAPVFSTTTVPSPETVASPQCMVETPTPTSESEIEPALLAQVAFATSYVQQTFGDNVASEELALSLDRLCQILREDQQVNRFRHVQQGFMQSGFDVGDMKMPPLELAISCIQKLRYSDKAIFVWTWDIDNIGQLLEYTTKVYTSKASFAELIIVNSNLSRLLPACAPDDDDDTLSAQRSELEMHARQCQQNLENILSRLPFNMAPNFDNVLALYQATIYALERGKSLTAWRYITASVQICQTLGYHREIALVPETIQQRRRRKRLVWMIVIFDKGLSLRIGQPSAIRNNEFTLQRLADATQDDVSAIGPSSLLSKWIDFSLLQGKIYDELYSPGALLQAQNIRVTRAQQLAADLQRIFNAEIPTETHFYEARRRALGDDTHRLFCGADRIHFLTTLTLIYRIIPATSESGSAFCEECITTATEALDEHQKCLPILGNVKNNTLQTYLQWAFLSSPFVPYIVLFCRVFETCEPMYLEKLASVVKALCLLPQELPEANKHQLRIFKSMYDVAYNYLHANKHDQSRGCVLSSTDVDMIFRDVVIGGGFDVAYGECTTMDVVEA